MDWYVGGIVLPPLFHQFHRKIMKSLLSFSIVLLFVIVLAGCETDPNSSVGAPDIRPMAAGASDANPAIVYKTTKTSKGQTYPAVGVMDSNGTNQTVIYTGPSATITFPSWSPSGGTVSFLMRDDG